VFAVCLSRIFRKAHLGDKTNTTSPTVAHSGLSLLLHCTSLFTTYSIVIVIMAAIVYENCVIPKYESTLWLARDQMQGENKPTGMDIEHLLVDCIETSSKNHVIRYNKFQTAAVALAQGDLSSYTVKTV
jgi:hypothetical protein